MAHTARFDKVRPCLILGIGSNGVQTRTNLCSDLVCQRLRTVEMADETRDLDLRLEVEIKHEILGIDMGSFHRVCRGDMDVTPSERDKGPIFGVEDITHRLHQDFSDGDLGLEDQAPLNLEEMLEVARLGNVIVGGGYLGCVARQLLIKTLPDLRRSVRVQMGDCGIGDKIWDLGVVSFRLVFHCIIHLVLQVLADGGKVYFGLDAVFG